jgi:HAD superfamily hydrolase (TIGR01509 family)
LTHQRPFDAIIFDHDGTLVDTETPDIRACQMLYNELNAPFDPQQWAALVAGSMAGYDILLEELAAFHGNDLTRNDLWKRLRELWAITYEQVELAPGVQQLLPQLHTAGYPLAVASASNRKWIERWMSTFDLLPYFQAIASSDDVRHNKPAPDVYLFAAAQLGVTPEKCLVFEDSLTGVQSAKAAGMTVVAVPSHITQTLDFSHADAVIAGLDKMSLNEMAALARK